jgi:hypothetical protein
MTSAKPSRAAVVRRTFIILGVIFLLIGFIGLGSAGAFAMMEVQSGRTAKADGVMVSADYRALIQFTTVAGQSVQFRNSINSTDNVVGTHVPVAYDPAEPEGAAVDGFAGRWFFAGLAAIISTPMFLVGLGFTVAALVLGRRRAA